MFDYMEYSSFLNQWEVGAKYTVDRNGNFINPTFTLELSNSEGLTQSEVISQISSFNATCTHTVQLSHR